MFIQMLIPFNSMLRTPEMLRSEKVLVQIKLSLTPMDQTGYCCKPSERRGPIRQAVWEFSGGCLWV